MFLDLFATIFTIILTVWGFFISSPVIVLPETPVTQGTITAHVVRVIDGDTIEVVVATGTPAVRVRYIGVDTPEPYAHGVPDCGSHEATSRNQSLVTGAMVTLVPGRDPYDQYGRLLAYVYVEDVFVNQTLLAEGWARRMMVRPNTQFSDTFKTIEADARERGLGVWGLCPDGWR